MCITLAYLSIEVLLVKYFYTACDAIKLHATSHVLVRYISQSLMNGQQLNKESERDKML